LIFEQNVLHAVIYVNLKSQIDDVETTFCSPATPKSGNDLDIPKPQAEADLDGPKSLSLTSTYLFKNSLGRWCECDMWIITLFPVPLSKYLMPNAIYCFFHTRRG
jgi:hypothetical protein